MSLPKAWLRLFKFTALLLLFISIVWFVTGCSSGGPSNGADGPGAGPIDEPTSFQENFEDGDYTGWYKNYPDNTIPVHYQVTVDQPGANGTTKCISLEGGRNKTTWDGLYTVTSDFVLPTYVGFYVKTACDNTTAGCFELTAGSSPPGLSFRFTHLKKIVVNNTECADYQANTWYHVEFKEINWTTHTFNFYLDGTLIRSDLTIPSYIDYLGDISLFNTDPGSQAWWDEIEIQE